MPPDAVPPESAPAKPDTKALADFPKLRSLVELVLGLGALGAAVDGLRRQLLNPGARSDFLVGLFTLLLLGGVFLLWRLLQRRRAPKSRFTNPAALHIGRKYLLGRDEDVEAIHGRLREFPLVFLIGESGAGKSALLELGLLPKLRSDSTLFPVYLDHWGSDWAEGPRQALALELYRALDTTLRERLGLHGPLPSQQALAVVERLYDETGRLPVLLFDQFDDYYARHRTLLVRGRQRRVLRPEKLIQENPFWRDVARLLAAGKLRCLFAVRDDAALALEPVRFCPPELEVYPLDRLDRSYAAQLLEEVSREAGLVHPEAGFEQLRGRLLADLGPDNLVLPAQMKLAFRGLADLAPPTVGNYAKAGGLRGLEALSIEREIAQAARHAGYDAAELRLLLLSLVDPETRSKKARTESELLGFLLAAKRDPAKLALALHSLRDADIVRQAVGADPEQAVWQLDHDYLCLSLVEIDRRSRPWQFFLAEAAEAFAAARGLAARWRALLPWKSQLRLAYERLRGHLSYGSARSFALLSTLRFLLLLLVLLAPIGAIRFLRSEQETAARDARFDAWGLPSDLYDRVRQLQGLGLAGKVNSLKWLGNVTSLTMLDLTDSEVKDLKGLPKTVTNLTLAGPSLVAKIPPTIRDLRLDLRRLAFGVPYPNLSRLPSSVHSLSLWLFPSRELPSLTTLPSSVESVTLQLMVERATDWSRLGQRKASLSLISLGPTLDLASLPPSLRLVELSVLRPLQLANLPPTITSLTLASLGQFQGRLPPNLSSLALGYTPTTPVALASIPGSVRHLTLFCGGEFRSLDLRDLPRSITSLSLTVDKLRVLPPVFATVPSSVRRLAVNLRADQVARLRELPASVESLALVVHGEPQSLPAWPRSLTALNIVDTRIARLSGLPPSLLQLAVREEQLSTLEGLPSSVRTLWFSKSSRFPWPPFFDEAPEKPGHP
jgi:hypothetical protein